MSEHVVKIESSDILDLKRILLTNRQIKEIKTTNPYEEFRLEYEGGFIVGYSTGKVVATNEATKYYLADAVVKLRPADYDIMIGSDEAGKGEWLGPLIIVAVALTPAQSAVLRAEGIMDSKELSVKKILDLSKTIKRNCLSFKSVLISPQKFNEKMLEFKHEQRTLNDFLAWGHSKAIETVYSDFKGKPLKIKIIIDEFDKLKTEIRLKRVIDLKDLELIQKPKAEEEIAVAAASIIARSGWEEWVDRESKLHGIELRKLSSSNVMELGKAASLFAKISFIKNKAK